MIAFIATIVAKAELPFQSWFEEHGVKHEQLLMCADWLALITALYYLIWFINKAVKAGKGFWTRVQQFVGWLGKLFWPSKIAQRQAGDISRDVIRQKLGHSLLESAADSLTLLRAALLVALAWRWIRMRGFEQPWLDDPACDFEPLGSIILMICVLVYLCLTYFANRTVIKAQNMVDIDTSDSSVSSPGSAWSRRIPDVFFVPAIYDVIFILVAGICLPGEHSEVHLAFLIPLASAWLFKNEGRMLIIWMLISFALAAHATTVHYLTAQLGQTADAVSWQHLIGTHLPRILFWLLVTAVMMVMRQMRRRIEDYAAFFRTLAECMPFEVFVKDRDFRFYYANARLLQKLAHLQGKDSLNLENDVIGKNDLELKVEPEKAHKYQIVDQSILDGSREHYQEFEVTYALGSQIEIETTKVPIKQTSADGNEAVAYILGVCRDPRSDTDLWYFVNVVGRAKPHCFFHKHAGRVKWANDAFIRDAGHHSLKDVLEKSDRDLYETKLAERYERDDESLSFENPMLEKEEWHQPKGMARRRVFVHKEFMEDPQSGQKSVRGYFCDIHEDYLRQIFIERLISRHLDPLTNSSNTSGIQQTRKISVKSAIGLGLKLLPRLSRLLNIRENDLRQTASHNLQDAPQTYANLGWSPVDFCPGTNKLLEEVLPLLDLLAPNCKFHFNNDGSVDQTIKMDIQWLQAAALSLGMFAVARWRRFKSVGSSCTITLRVGHENVTTDGNAISIFYLAVIDHTTDPATDKLSANELAEWVDESDESMALGLHLGIRIARLCLGDVVREPNADGSPGSTFKLRCYRQPNRSVSA